MAEVAGMEIDMTPQRARQVLDEMYPDAKCINVINHGYDNIVGLVDESYAVRFPRNATAYQRSQYEKAVLQSFHCGQTLEVPVVLGEHADPPALIVSYLHGEQHTGQEVNDYPIALQEQFAKDVAHFAYTLHKSLSVEEVRGLRKRFAIDELDGEWGDSIDEQFSDANLSPLGTRQREAVKRYHDAWKRQNEGAEPVVVHDDLHMGNMLLQGRRLTAVLDFGDTAIGMPEQELRHLYRINERVLSVAVETYGQLSGKPVDIEAAKTWAVIQELGSFVGRLSRGELDHPSFGRACGNLNAWLPEGRWGAAQGL
ncbi:hypothetical protein CR970_02615 [Candidatus Saccharibacteria bacterium]|nr:MAG: hypothetical protein CR970_02615 [Candidatus Saccharibacteria bacterium]